MCGTESIFALYLEFDRGGAGVKLVKLELAGLSPEGHITDVVIKALQKYSLVKVSMR